MKQWRQRQRERQAELELARARADDPPALASFRAKLRAEADPEVRAVLKDRVIHLEKLYGRRPGGIVAGDADRVMVRSTRTPTTPQFNARITPKVATADPTTPTARREPGLWLDRRLAPSVDP
jgi:hypothetical protein